MALAVGDANVRPIRVRTAKAMGHPTELLVRDRARTLHSKRKHPSTTRTATAPASGANTTRRPSTLVDDRRISLLTSIRQGYFGTLQLSSVSIPSISQVQRIFL
jgi:hypothetical protein